MLRDMRSHKKIFGIIQGRLTQSPPGHLQWFPQGQWEKEFFLAGKLGLGYIELIAEREHNGRNPLWMDEGIKKIKILTKKNNLTIHVFCDDFIINHSLIGDRVVLDQVLRLISRGALLGMKKLVLPLFEKSELNENNFNAFTHVLEEIAQYGQQKHIIICIETILDGKQLLRFLRTIKHPNIKVVFDVGNRIAFGHDIYSDIVTLRDFIAHVHIKDKNDQSENVLLGTGKVDFQRAFKSFLRIGYSGPYTFETCRGNNPLLTAQYNKMFAEFFIGEAASHEN